MNTDFQLGAYREVLKKVGPIAVVRAGPDEVLITLGVILIPFGVIVGALLQVEQLLHFVVRLGPLPLVLQQTQSFKQPQLLETKGHNVNLRLQTMVQQVVLISERQRLVLRLVNRLDGIWTQRVVLNLHKILSWRASVFLIC